MPETQQVLPNLLLVPKVMPLQIDTGKQSTVPGAGHLAPTWSPHSLPVRAGGSQPPETSASPSFDGDRHDPSPLGQHFALPRPLLTLGRKDVVPLFQTWDSWVKSRFYQ